MNAETAAYLAAQIADTGATVASIFTPRDAGSGWRVTLRDGPAWVVGPLADTLAEAMNGAAVALRKEWGDKRNAVAPSKPIAIDGELEALLG